MAFVAKLPTRDMYLQEGQYGSKLHLRLNPNTHCCDGTYEPASLDLADIEADLPNAVDLEGERSPGGAAPGHAVLFGQVKPDPESGSNGFVLKGEWRHVQGPLQGGKFEMKLDSHGNASGFWATEGEETSTDWQWTPSHSETAGLLKGDDESDVHIVQTSASARPSLRASLSSRTDRGKTFYDEMLAAEGSFAVWIARWGVFCAWIFFYQTLAALVMASFQITGNTTCVVQLVFQVVYTCTYTSFLGVYSRMRVMPPLDYVLGVVLYTLGYACFVALYAVVLVMEDAEDAAMASSGLYLAGSLLFLAGSAVLVRATVPPPIPMVMRELSFTEHVRARFSMIDQQSSLFWGSMAFLMGSVLFTVDSAWGLHGGSKPALASVFNISMGYALFTVGRLYFLWGSTTADCDALFGREGWRERFLSNWFASPKDMILRKVESENRAFERSASHELEKSRSNLSRCMPAPSMDEHFKGCVPNGFQVRSSSCEGGLDEVDLV